VAQSRTEATTSPTGQQTESRRGVGDGLIVAALTVAILGFLTSGWIVADRLVAQVDPFVVAEGRLFSSFVTLSLAAVLGKQTRSVVHAVVQRPRALVLLALSGFVVYFGATIFGLGQIGLTPANLIVSSLPCVTFVLGIAFFGEQVRARKVVGTGLAVLATGGYILSATGSGPHVSARAWAMGVTATLAGTIAYALYSLFYKKWMADLPSIAALPGITALATVCLLPLALMSGRIGSVTLAQWGEIALLGGVLTAPIFFLAHELIQRRSALFSATAGLSLPFLVRIANWLLGAAPAPDLATVLCLLACAAGTWLTISAPTSPKGK
jgi:drug/metabolite transporter (DMT)-like permease